MADNLGSAHAQFEKEAAAFKEVIFELIESGQSDAALQLLEQYALLNPSDPDIGSIKKTISPDTDAGGAGVPDEYELLKNIETIFILSGIIIGRAGHIDSVLRKIRFMEEKWGYSPLLLTCVHNIEQRQARIWLQTAGAGQVSLSPAARILNVYDYFQKSFADGLENKAVYMDMQSDAELRYVSTAANTFEVYDGDKLLRKEFYTGYMGSLRTVRCYKDGKREKDITYDDWGYVSYVREFSKQNEAFFGEKYFTTDGNLCIEAFYKNTKDAKEGELEKLVVYDEKGSIIRECADSSELAALCLEQIIKGDKFYMLVVEDGLMVKAAALVDAGIKNAAKCEVVHSIFLNDAYDPASGPQPFFEYLCENQSMFDAIVLLTEAAKKDFVDIYKNPDNTFVIPNAYPYEIKQSDFDERDHLKAVIVSRLDRLKYIDLSIDIFALVAKEMPEAKLEIYGRGPDEERLRKHIKKKGLENNVFLMGYTENPLALYSKSALFMTTSAIEGHPLTLIESICSGCPAFAFDIKYGPSEIIENGRTGFLIPRLDIKMYAKKMTALFKDKNMQKTMSENCYASAHRFSAKNYLNTWYKMTETLYSRWEK